MAYVCKYMYVIALTCVCKYMYVLDSLHQYILTRAYRGTCNRPKALATGLMHLQHAYALEGLHEFILTRAYRGTCNRPGIADATNFVVPGFISYL